MDSWQRNTVKMLQDFVDTYPPGRVVRSGEEAVQINITVGEAYTLLNICEQWEKLSHPLLAVGSTGASNGCE